MRITTAAEMRQIDAESLSHYGISELQLMENAGTAAFTVLLDRFRDDLETPLVVAGTGNNGGDGFVVARRLLSHGFRPAVLLATDESRLKGSARVNFEIVQKIGIPVYNFTAGADTDRLLSQSSMFIDALFGTGLSEGVRDPYESLIQTLNAQGKPTLSLDIPSGVSADTGEILNVAVEASATVTFGLPKWGNLFYPGAAYGGELFVSRLSFPPALLEHDRLQGEISLPVTLPARPANGHKGIFGRLLVIGGSRRYLGAPRLAAAAFLRSGGGMAYLAVPAGISAAASAELWEAVVVPLAESSAGTLCEQSLEGLKDALEICDIVVVGPGLSLTPDTEALVVRLCAESKQPLIVDGDGLTLVASHFDVLRARRAPTILTPHPGEFCRLAGCSQRDLQHNRVQLLRELARSAEATVVLKGAPSLVAGPSGAVWLNRTGNSGMGTAGAGDVLDGVIAACLAHGLLPLDAVRMGVLIHGEAGDTAREYVGEDGLIARDIVEALPRVFVRHRDGVPPLSYGLPVVEELGFAGECSDAV